MSVKHSIEEIFDLKDPYIPSESVIEHKEELKMSLKELEEDREMSDIVNQPPHYISDNGIETIDVIEAFTKNLEPFEAYCTGNIIKYICRWKHKNGLEDLKKAKWYINKLLGEENDSLEDLGWKSIDPDDEYPISRLKDDKLLVDIKDAMSEGYLRDKGMSYYNEFRISDGTGLSMTITRDTER